MPGVIGDTGFTGATGATGPVSIGMFVCSDGRFVLSRSFFHSQPLIAELVIFRHRAQPFPNFCMGQKERYLASTTDPTQSSVTNAGSKTDQHVGNL